MQKKPKQSKQFTNISDSKMKEMYSWNSVGFISKQKLAFLMLLKHTD